MIRVLTDWNIRTCCLFTYLLVWVYCQTVIALSCHVIMSSWQYVFMHNYMLTFNFVTIVSSLLSAA